MENKDRKEKKKKIEDIIVHVKKTDLSLKKALRGLQDLKRRHG